ncbi:SMI1/KNR4 family protein [Microbulbifer variabilis]|uniref:SMI1/KNR4 family protein n=1 Tax=Microbulbifer variabilis TaxID=266805 RepID=UPI00037DE89A|nr:SMI1/KNR4 family protein [Microbulbifer variabilis]
METHFKEIEDKLGLILPEFYKSALLNYPFKPLDEIDCVEDNLVKELEWITITNLELRKCHFYGNLWPPHFLAIGHDGFGNFMFLNLKEHDKTIYFADHEEEFDSRDISDLELAADMEEYIQLCKEEQEDVVKKV